MDTCEATYGCMCGGKMWTHVRQHMEATCGHMAGLEEAVLAFFWASSIHLLNSWN